MFGINSSLAINVCEDAADAIAKGHVYGEDVIPVEIVRAVVVRNGTVEGKPTVDLVMKDQAGNTYVVGITGALLKMIPC